MVRQEKYGPIAPGMTKKVFIQIRLSDPKDTTKIKEEIQIMTKADVFKVPVEAVLLNEEEYKQKEAEIIQETGNGLINSRVRNRLTQSIQLSRSGSVMASFKQQQEVEKQRNHQLLGQQPTSEDMDNFNQMDDNDLNN